MREPLVDREGFPRADLDVPAVRTLRRQVACLQTDHCELMRRVEAALVEHHAHLQQMRDLPPPPPPASAAPADGATGAARDLGLFVAEVTAGSPSAVAGLAAGDRIVCLGSVRPDNVDAGHAALRAVSDAVRHSEGQPMTVELLRDGRPHGLVLVPRRWAGAGLLGCGGRADRRADRRH